MALPLAPADRFDEGLGLLTNLADEIEQDHPEVLQFLSYLRRQWRPLADVVSVYKCPHRTNNLVESFHNEAKRKLGGLHPSIWKFIGISPFLFSRMLCETLLLYLLVFLRYREKSLFTV